MAASTQRVPYPDNLWNRVFEDNRPVPADAAETLAFLQQKIVDPIKKQILDLRFKEGKTMPEIASIVGKTDNQVRLLTEKAIRCMDYARLRIEKRATLSFGLEVHNSIVEGTMGECHKCKKLIEGGAKVFVVPYYKEFSCLKNRENPVLRLYCSRECANASIAANIEQHEESIQERESKIKELMNEKCLFETEIQLLNDYRPEPMTLKEAHDRLIACE